ncbi:hypothetical protein K6119_04945 [Paracrocinitomix mangrovi]|uniref:hypothetical protein n=1 Tax=Paracrocinitomix mangrovi TaxID=2862509 RepID=UPI001C8D1B48|nr:hypothetical protein [Paracrocinitomix mangrovi]UKN02860.1 hypothetical protein K6119_04945 [Paracrocinitomix mangrovi]
MSIADIFEHGERKQDKGHFRNLVMIANSDGELAEAENKLLNVIGSELGLTKEQIEAIKSNPEKYPVIPPADRTERFEQMVNLIQMVQVDGNVDDAEMDILEKIAVGIGYNSIDDVDVESIVALIVRGEDIEVIIDELL